MSIEATIPSSLFCLPERVPDFSFPSPLLTSLVTWLDAAETSHFSLQCEKNLTTQGLLAEFYHLDLHQQICCKCVTGWLLHRVRSETEVFPEILLEVDRVISDHLGSYIGSSSNIGFFYNWTCDDVAPGKSYSTDLIKEERIRSRFKLLPGDVGQSFDQFMIGHVVMEAFANDAFSAALEIYDLLDQQKPIDHQLNILYEVAMQFSRVFAKYFHPEKTTKAEHWVSIQKCLKLPEFIGMGGVQNTSIHIFGLIIGLSRAAHPLNAKLEMLGCKHYTHQQRTMIDGFANKRDVLKNYMNTSASETEVQLYCKITERLASWRSVHARRVRDYISAATSNNHSLLYESSVNQKGTISEIQQQFDHRIFETHQLNLLKERRRSES